jgi:hypothetical protein
MGPVRSEITIRFTLFEYIILGFKLQTLNWALLIKLKWYLGFNFLGQRKRPPGGFTIYWNKEPQSKFCISIVYIGRTRPDPIRETRPHPNPIRLDFKKKKSNWSDLFRSDPRSNDLQSNRNILKIWKNTIYKLIQPDYFQKVKLTWPVRLHL